MLVVVVVVELVLVLVVELVVVLVVVELVLVLVVELVVVLVVVILVVVIFVVMLVMLVVIVVYMVLFIKEKLIKIENQFIDFHYLKSQSEIIIISKIIPFDTEFIIHGCCNVNSYCFVLYTKEKLIKIEKILLIFIILNYNLTYYVRFLLPFPLQIVWKSQAKLMLA